MKKVYFLFILIPILILSIFLYNNQRNNIIIIVGTPTPPFEYYDENNNLVGIDIEFLDKIFTKLNLKYEIKLMDWELALNEIQNKKADMILGAGYTKEREKYISYTTEQKMMNETKIIPNDALWISAEKYFFKKNKDLDLSSFESIKNEKYRVGIVNGYAYFDELWETDLNFYAYPNTEKLIIGLNDEEIDLAIIDSLEAQIMINNLNLNGEISSTTESLNIAANYILFSKKYDYGKYSKIKNDFYEELNRLKREENLHETLYKKYTGNNFSETYSGII